MNRYLLKFLILVLNWLETTVIPDADGVNHILGNLRGLIHMRYYLCRFELWFQEEAEHTWFDLFLFLTFNISISNGSYVCVGFRQLKIFSWWNSKRHRIVHIDFSALRFNKKEWLAVWIHEIWLIRRDYACIESNPQTGIHPFLFDLKLFNVIWIASP